MRVASCPKRLVSSGVWKLCEDADLMELTHAMPEAGGLNDQTVSFRSAYAVLKSDEADWNDRKQEK